MATIKTVTAMARECGLVIATARPGDGTTRYRFFLKDEPSIVNGYATYDGTRHPLGTVRGAREATLWLEGFRAALLAVKQTLEL